MFYHRLNTPQSEDVLVWHGEGDDATSQIVGRPHVMSCKETDATKRSWMLWDIYRNTNPETECFVIDIPTDVKDLGHRLKEVLEGNKRWLTKGWTGQTTCRSTLGDIANKQISGLSLLTYTCSSPLPTVSKPDVFFHLMENLGTPSPI